MDDGLAADNGVLYVFAFIVLRGGWWKTQTD